jgi:hypothetical protein
MSVPVLTGEEAAEFQRLYAEYAAAMVNALAILRAKGMSSEEFRQADAAAGALRARIRELQGTAGKHWMA